MPQTLNWYCQARWVERVAGHMATTRLPTTGPRVQKPIAEARPSCGEKSRIRAGVATRMMPSTRLTTRTGSANVHLSWAFGMPNEDEQRR